MTTIDLDELLDARLRDRATKGRAAGAPNLEEPTLLELVGLWLMLSLLIVLKIVVLVIETIQHIVKEARSGKRR